MNIISMNITARLLCKAPDIISLILFTPANINCTIPENRQAIWVPNHYDFLSNQITKKRILRKLHSRYVILSPIPVPLPYTCSVKPRNQQKNNTTLAIPVPSNKSPRPPCLRLKASNRQFFSFARGKKRG